jgi:hypothetical protein
MHSWLVFICFSAACLAGLLLRQQRKQLTDCTSVQVSFLPRLPKTPTKPGARGDDDEDSARSRMQDPVATGDALEFDFTSVGGTEEGKGGESQLATVPYHHCSEASGDALMLLLLCCFAASSFHFISIILV